MNKREACQNIFDKLRTAPKFHPGSVNGFADWTVQSGDMVTIHNEGDTPQMPIFGMTLNWNGSPTVSLQATGNEERSPIKDKTRSGRSGYGRQSEVEETTTELYSRWENTDAELTSVKGRTTTVEERVSTAESEIKQNADAITLKVSSTDFTGENITSLINQTADTIKISAKHIELQGAVVAEALQTQDIAVGNITGYRIGAQLGAFTDIQFAMGLQMIDLRDHSHEAIVDDTTGVVTLGKVSRTGGSFNIADTQYFKAAMSAIRCNALNNASARYSYDDETDKRFATISFDYKLSNGNEGQVQGLLDVTDYWQEAYDLGRSQGGGTYTESSFTHNGSDDLVARGWTLREDGSYARDLYTRSAVSGNTYTLGNYGGEIRVSQYNADGEIRRSNTYTFNGAKSILVRTGSGTVYTTATASLVYTPSTYE